MLYVKRIMTFHAVYGKLSLILGMIFMFANMIQFCMNFYLGSGGIITVEDLGAGTWSAIFVPFYIFTEVVPAVTFAYVCFKYGELFPN
jgi:hypothetical protein